MKMIKCSKCFSEESELYVDFPEEGNKECDYWLLRVLNHQDFYFCENCADDLIELERKALNQILIDFIQPERSKREDFIEYYFLYEALPFRTLIKKTFSLEEAISWQKSGDKKCIRTYKKLYKHKDAVL